MRHPAIVIKDPEVDDGILKCLSFLIDSEPGKCGFVHQLTPDQLKSAGLKEGGVRWENPHSIPVGHFHEKSGNLLPVDVLKIEDKFSKFKAPPPA